MALFNGGQKAMLNIYLAGPLFGIADRSHNFHLAKHLETIGYQVILPQVRALNFSRGDLFDLPAVVEDCVQLCKDPQNICVANIDGPDADSGTAFECGVALASTGRAIVCRTDFRTYPEKEIGWNAMFMAKGIIRIYHPCSAIADPSLVNSYYMDLAGKIHSAIISMVAEAIAA